MTSRVGQTGKVEEQCRKLLRRRQAGVTPAETCLTSQDVPPCLFSTNTVGFIDFKKEMLGQLIENVMRALCCCPGF